MPPTFALNPINDTIGTVDICTRILIGLEFNVSCEPKNPDDIFTGIFGFFKEFMQHLLHMTCSAL